MQAGMGIERDVREVTPAEAFELAAEVDFWREDALARLQTACERHVGLIAQGDEEGAARICVETIYPTLAAWDAAAEKRWHPSCPLCGEPLPLSEPHRHIVVDDDGSTERVHEGCGDPADRVYPGDVEDAGKIIAEARAVRGSVA